MSSNKQKKSHSKKTLSEEARRILFLLDGSQQQDNVLMKDENGRPYFSDLHADFSISHSVDTCAVSMVTGKNLHTGCDIELARPRVNAREIAEKFFSAQERDYSFSTDSKAGFYTIWTLKECFLKLRGLSVFDMHNAPSFICDKGHFAFGSEVLSPLSFYVYELQGKSGEIYLLSAAIEGAKDLRPEIRWFSQSPLPARIIVEINAALNPTETVSPKR